jgi:hypothetical protein
VTGAPPKIVCGVGLRRALFLTVRRRDAEEARQASQRGGVVWWWYTGFDLGSHEEQKEHHPTSIELAPMNCSGKHETQRYINTVYRFFLPIKRRGEYHIRFTTQPCCPCCVAVNLPCLDIT